MAYYWNTLGINLFALPACRYIYYSNMDFDAILRREIAWSSCCIELVGRLFYQPTWIASSRHSKSTEMWIRNNNGLNFLTLIIRVSIHQLAASLNAYSRNVQVSQRVNVCCSCYIYTKQSRFFHLHSTRESGRLRSLFIPENADAMPMLS